MSKQSSSKGEENVIQFFVKFMFLTLMFIPEMVTFLCILTSNLMISVSAAVPLFLYHILPSSMSRCRNRVIGAPILPLPRSTQPLATPLGGTGTIIMISPEDASNDSITTTSVNLL